MECTQRLEYTQDENNIPTEKTCPEQIGFLGICGSKQPVKKGPNKVGRDPQTCSIVLNDNSISRQHAVINILNKKDFMLMDLDSSNKTKLMGKTLEPYIPHPLKNGDTVQFGQVFGIFRLLEEDDYLPMTQALDIPETPVNTRHISRLKAAPATTIPESPDVSDRDDSVVGQPQSNKKTDLKSSNNNFIKSSEKIPGVQQLGVNKIDNVYWNSSKKSDSFSSNFESNSSFTVNKSFVSPKKFVIENSIYDMETQAPGCLDNDKTSNSIYEANTQVPSSSVSPNIYSCETQIPNIEKLPEVFKVLDQSNVRLNLYSKNENNYIFEAETQVTLQGKEKSVTPIPSSAKDTVIQESDAVSSINKKLNSSDEEICFDEIDCEQFDDDCGSQPLLPPHPCDIKNLETTIGNQENTKIISVEKNTTRSTVLNDSDSKDCEEIAPSQLVPERPMDDDDVTDCEDNMLELAVNLDRSNKIPSDDDMTDCEEDLNNVNIKSKEKTAGDEDLTDCEDDVIAISQNRSKVSNAIQSFEDLPTQVIGAESLEPEKIPEIAKDDVPFEDMLTQVIEEYPIECNIIANNTHISEQFQPQIRGTDTIIHQEQSSISKQIEINNGFKRPFSSPRPKKKESASIKSSTSTTVVIKKTDLQRKLENDHNYYDATQEILDDLCTQNEPLDNPPLCMDKNMLARKRSSKDSDTTEKIDSFVSNLSKEQVREVIGADAFVVPLTKKKSSDSSDLEVTPKKFNLSKFLMIDLPNSQEIKSCDFVSSKVDDTDSSDGFEKAEEQDNNKHSPPTGSHRKRRRKKDIKVDLMKKFDGNALSIRAVTRLRKPTSKILDSDKTTKKVSEKSLQSKLELGGELEMEKEAIELNLKRLKKEKSKTSNNSRKSEKDEKVDQSKQIKIVQSLPKSKHQVKESKEHELPKSNEKELKQQNIKSMFKESSSKDATIDVCRNTKTESIDSSHKSRRSSRIKNKGDKKEVRESCERKRSSSRTDSSSKQVKETINLIKDQETVIRRSRRHQATKDKTEDKNEKSRKNKEKKEYKVPDKLDMDTSDSIRIKKPSNIEHSTVYNLSSETAVDSPNLKRQATSDILPTNTKKAKSSNTANVSVRATPLRGIKTQHVLFTAFPCEEVKLKLEKLGAVIVSDVKSCTVVLTLQIRRTFKLLCALGLGKPIVGPNWVQACADSNMIVDPWLYLMKDEATEKRFGFNLRQSLTCKRNFLKSYNVFCTPNVTPNPQEMKSIVECSGGTWKEGGRSWFCVSCSADKALWPGLRKRGATLVSTEFILGGVLQQRINLDRDKLG